MASRQLSDAPANMSSAHNSLLGGTMPSSIDNEDIRNRVLNEIPLDHYMRPGYEEVFSTKEEALARLQNYAFTKGFAVKLSDSLPPTIDGKKRFIVRCVHFGQGPNKEELMRLKRKYKDDQRIGCQCAYRFVEISGDDPSDTAASKWIVSEFDDWHTHDMALNVETYPQHKARWREIIPAELRETGLPGARYAIVDDNVVRYLNSVISKSKKRAESGSDSLPGQPEKKKLMENKEFDPSKLSTGVETHQESQSGEEFISKDEDATDYTPGKVLQFEDGASGEAGPSHIQYSDAWKEHVSLMQPGSAARKYNIDPPLLTGLLHAANVHEKDLEDMRNVTSELSEMSDKAEGMFDFFQQELQNIFNDDSSVSPHHKELRERELLETFVKFKNYMMEITKTARATMGQVDKVTESFDALKDKCQNVNEVQAKLIYDFTMIKKTLETRNDDVKRLKRNLKAKEGLPLED